MSRSQFRPTLLNLSRFSLLFQRSSSPTCKISLSGHSWSLEQILLPVPTRTLTAYAFSLPQTVFALQSRLFIWKCVIFYIRRCRRYIFMNNSNLQWGWREYTLIMCMSTEPWSTLNFIFGIRKEKHQLIWLWFDIKGTFYLFKYLANSKLAEPKAPPCVWDFEHKPPQARRVYTALPRCRGGFVRRHQELPAGCRNSSSPLQRLLVLQKASFWIFWPLKRVPSPTGSKLRLS